MPIKDKERLREYFKEYMAKRRQGLTNSDVKPMLNLNKSVKPDADSNLLTHHLLNQKIG